MPQQYVVVTVGEKRGEKVDETTVRVDEERLRNITLPVPATQSPIQFCESLYATGFAIWPQPDDEDQIVEIVPPYRIYGVHFAREQRPAPALGPMPVVAQPQ